jgi:capsular polysaccharide biosynthesis protein
MSPDDQNHARKLTPANTKVSSTVFDVIHILRRWWVAIAILTFVAMVVAFGYTAHQTKIYEADASTLIQRQSLASSLNGIVEPGAQVNEGPRVLQAQAQLATSAIIAARTLKLVPGTGLTVNDLLADLTVEPDANGDVLHFAIQNPSGPQAVRLVNTYTAQYVVYSTQVAKQDAIEATRTVNKQLKKLSNDGRKDSQEYQQLSRNLDSLKSIVSLATPTAQVINTATSFKKVKPKTLITLVLGIVLGLGLGIGLAFLLEALQPRYRAPESVADVLGLPMLAAIPSDHDAQEPVTLADRDGPAAEAYRILRAALVSVDADSMKGSLLVTSDSDAAAASAVAANLAIVSARSGRPTTLIDLAFGGSVLTPMLRGQGDPGSTDIVVAGASTADSILELAADPDRPDSHQSASLRFIPVGTQGKAATDLVGSPAVKDLIERIAESGDLVIIDAGGTASSSEGVSVGGFVDRIVVVGSTESSKPDTLESARRRLELSTGRPLGVAVFVTE